MILFVLRWIVARQATTVADLRAREFRRYNSRAGILPRTYRKKASKTWHI
jgi:hypothetical protein